MFQKLNSVNVTFTAATTTTTTVAAAATLHIKCHDKFNDSDIDHHQILEQEVVATVKCSCKKKKKKKEKKKGYSLYCAFCNWFCF